MFKKVKYAVLKQLKQGATPKGIALTCGLATIAAMFPVLGATTFLCIFLGHLFKANHPLMLLINYSLSAVHLVLIPVFIRVGESLVGAPHVTINPIQATHKLFHNWHAFIADYGMATLYGIFVWAIIAPPSAWLVYKLSLPMIQKLSKRNSAQNM